MLVITCGEYLDQTLLLVGGVMAFLLLIYILVMVIVFGNGFNTTFTVGDNGFSYDSGSRESKISKGAVAVSLLAGSCDGVPRQFLRATFISSHWILHCYRLQQPLHTHSVRIWAILYALLTNEQLGGEGVAAALAALLTVCLW